MFSVTCSSRVRNLAKFAVGMNPLQADRHILIPGSGTSGLPSITNGGSISQPQLRIEFVQRVQAGISYHPEFSTDLQTWTEASGSQLTTLSINANWSRVIATDPSAGGPLRFGRVRLTNP